MARTKPNTVFVHIMLSRFLLSSRKNRTWQLFPEQLGNNITQKLRTIKKNTTNLKSPFNFNTMELRDRVSAFSQLHKFPRSELKNFSLNKRNFMETQEKIAEKTSKMGHGAMALVKKYGACGIVVYFSVYFVSLGLGVVAVKAGLVTGKQVKDTIEKIPIIRDHVQVEDLEKKVETTAGQFVIAWVICKIIEPLRFIATMAIVKPVHRHIWPLLMKTKPAIKVTSKAQEMFLNPEFITKVQKMNAKLRGSLFRFK